MKSSLWFLSFFLLINQLLTAQAPNWQWAKGIGNDDSDVSKSMTVDKNGNVYVVGGFYKPGLAFDTVTLTVGCAFIAKFNSKGKVIWAKNISDNPNNVDAQSISVDTLGNAYVVGDYFGPEITIGNITLKNNGIDSRDVFFVKYDVNGNVLWAKEAGGEKSDRGKAVCTDLSGDVYVSGEYESAKCVFNTDTLVNTGREDIFLVKYNRDGDVIWLKNGDGGNTGIYSTSLITDEKGSVFLMGQFSSDTIRFDTLTLKKNGLSDIYILKYTSNGKLEWGKREGGSSYDTPTCIRTDKLGNAYLTGRFQSPTIIFGNTTIKNNYPQYPDLFIVKYDAKGVVLWAQAFGNTQSESASSIGCESNGDFYLAGTFSSLSIKFGTIVLNNSAGIGNGDAFIVKFNTTGNAIWAKQINKAGYNNMVAPDGRMNCYVVGNYVVPVIFGKDTVQNTSTAQNFYVAKLGDVILENKTLNHIENMLTISPNPFSSYTCIHFSEKIQKGTLQLLDANGKQLRTIQFSGYDLKIDKNNLSPGIYYINILLEEKRITKTVIIQ